MQQLMGIDREEYRVRRKAIFQQMPSSSIAVFHAAELRVRNGDAEYPFRQQSNFYYLTGYDVPHAVLLLTKDKNGASKTILFIKMVQPSEVIWTGPRWGLQEVIDYLGVDNAYDLTHMDAEMALLQQMHQLDMTEYVHALRLKKSPAELVLMKKAAEISANAHIRVMKACRPGLMEYVLEAEFLHEVTCQGCRALAYSSIVGGGAKACILHYVRNDQPLMDGDLVLVDAGGEYQYYASDITRTFPVNGHFTEDQALLYNLVLKAQLAAIEMIAPGLPWDALQKTVVRTLVFGLVELGILQGDVETLIAEKAYLSVYMHGSGHWLGLDVHDVGGYVVNDAARLLEPGMVLTVEPGIYIPKNSPNIDKRWWGIGIRIEDDIAVTDTGYEVLSAAAPKTIKDIEVLMSRSL